MQKIKVEIKKANGPQGIKRVFDVLISPDHPFFEFLDQGIRGRSVLIKPNLLKARDPLCVTSPEVILNAVRFVKRLGASSVTVGDSPAFGSAVQVLDSLNIVDELKGMDVRVVDLKEPQRITLSSGIKVGISKEALDKDFILNLPRLKAHCQMGITCGVKNFFGTVVGFRKALYHVVHGKDRVRFASVLLEIQDHLPRSFTVLDAITPMHVTGPSGGRPFRMDLMVSSPSAVSLDTAIYVLLGAMPEEIPLWKEAQRQGRAGAFPEEIEFIGVNPSELSWIRRDFVFPRALTPINFSPIRFLKGRTKSLIRRVSSFIRM